MHAEKLPIPFLSSAAFSFSKFLQELASGCQIVRIKTRPVILGPKCFAMNNNR